MNKQQRGQFFTTSNLVQSVMLSLVKTTAGRVLEPSAGAGHLVKALECTGRNLDIDAIELDTSITQICDTSLIYSNFFTFADSTSKKYDLVFGNPPYVAWKNIEEASRKTALQVKKDYSDKTNLYHLFIDRCIDLLSPGGEMVLIVPKEWFYTSSASPLRKKILATGAITDIIDCGEEKLFEDADVPALLIFRYQKDKGEVLELDKSHVKFASNISDASVGNWEKRKLVDNNNRWLLLHDDLAKKVENWGKLGDVFSVKVGMVTGLDGAFRLPKGHGIESEVVRGYMTTKGLEEFLDANHISDWNLIPPHARSYLFEYKEALLNRKIAKFDETNWWKYGAVRNKNAMASNADRLYAYCKTRKTHPFFGNAGNHFFGGGLLGLFSKSDDIDMDKALKILNSADFREVMESMFLATGNKVSLQPATLEDAPFPVEEIKLS